tara:strand:- start:3196 stop:4311 length:1116 start_codon:yes stop_codon:yes gene_type:complete
MDRIYDFIVIGAGISACTFASCINKRFSDASILLVEHGRRLGGRATTRKSRKNATLEFDHGLPSINFSQHISEDIVSLISPLIHSKKLVNISNDLLMINEIGDITPALTNDQVYRSLPFMINFCEEIINQSINPKKIDFLFKTLTKSIKYINYLWEVQVNNGRIINSKNLILSSSLIAHPRCLELLKINSIPLSDAFTKKSDRVIDSVIKETRKQKYLQRKIYILHVSDSELVKNFNKKYLQISFSNTIRKDFNFERIIFQKQFNGSMVIVLHCCYINNHIDKTIDKILNSLKVIFFKHKHFLDLFLQARLIDQMFWRASQPLNNLLLKELQWSSINSIGFCGDWFDSNTTNRVESAMNSSIRLAKILTWK